eukprot:9470053-Pyramimonas_sp.AAC.1
MSALLIPAISCNVQYEDKFENLKEHFRTELQRQSNASEHVSKLAEAIHSAGSTKAGGDGTSQVSEHIATKQ